MNATTNLTELAVFFPDTGRSGIDLSAKDRDNKAVTKVAQRVKTPVEQHASRPVTLKGRKALKAVEPVRFFILYDQQVIEAISFSDTKTAERYAAGRYANPVIVTSEADYFAKHTKLPKSGPALQKKQDAARAKAMGATGAYIPADPKDKAAVRAEKKAQREAAKQARLAAKKAKAEASKAAAAAKKASKPAAKKPATPKGEMSDAMKAELAACAKGKPTQSKLGSCMRMHLKMRGLVSDMKTGALTAEGKAKAKAK